MKKIKVKSLPSLIIIILLAIVSYFVTNIQNAQKNEIAKNGIDSSISGLEVAFIDVGQGDSLLIITPSGKTMLIDAGEKEFVNNVIDHLEKRNIKKIDVLVATHPHSDHIGGMQTIVEKFETGEIYMPKISHNTATYRNLLETISEKGKKVKTAKNGVKINLDDEINAEFLSPLKEEYDDLNNASAVLKLTYGKNSFLFTGDIESDAEKDMLDAGCDLKATVLKMPHHGSSTSSTPRFISAVNPQIAVISLGADNEYGHPHDNIVKRYEGKGVKLYRTDLCGTITIKSDGNTVAVED